MIQIGMGYSTKDLNKSRIQEKEGTLSFWRQMNEKKNELLQFFFFSGIVINESFAYDLSD